MSKDNLKISAQEDKNGLVKYTTNADKDKLCKIPKNEVYHKMKSVKAIFGIVDVAINTTSLLQTRFILASTTQE